MRCAGRIARLDAFPGLRDGPTHAMRDSAPCSCIRLPDCIPSRIQLPESRLSSDGTSSLRSTALRLQPRSDPPGSRVCASERQPAEPATGPENSREESVRLCRGTGTTNVPDQGQHHQAMGGAGSGCALPLVATMQDTLSPSEIVGASAGVAAWIVVMIRIHIWRLVDGGYGETTKLASSAATFMALQWIAWAVVPPTVLSAFYAPAVSLSARLVLAPLGLLEGPTAFVFTLACGSQMLACVLGLWWLLERIQQRVRPPRIPITGDVEAGGRWTTHRVCRPLSDALPGSMFSAGPRGIAGGEATSVEVIHVEGPGQHQRWARDSTVTARGSCHERGRVIHLGTDHEEAIPISRYTTQIAFMIFLLKRTLLRFLQLSDCRVGLRSPGY